MRETPLDQQDSRMPEPTLIEWLHDQQRVFDVGGASKDRRPELAATLLERVIRQRDQAQAEITSLRSQLGEARRKAIEECAQIATAFAEVTAKLDGGLKSTTAAGMFNIAKSIRALLSESKREYVEVDASERGEE